MNINPAAICPLLKHLYLHRTPRSVTAEVHSTPLQTPRPRHTRHLCHHRRLVECSVHRR